MKTQNPRNGDINPDERKEISRMTNVQAHRAGQNFRPQLEHRVGKLK